MDTKKLRQKILDLAIRGKLVPQDPNDEPASVLLERIRTEKERLIKEGKIKRSKKSPSDTPHYENEVPFEVPDGWEWTTIGDVCETCLGKMLDKQKNQGVLQPYLRNVNVRWGKFDLSDLLQMPFEDNENERYSICQNDLVVCEGGEPGRCAIWTAIDPIKFQKALHRVRCCKGIHNKYIQIILKTFSANGMIERYYTGSTIKHLTGDSLNSIQFPLPPTKEQTRIVDEVERWENVMDILIKEGEELSSVILQTKCRILNLALQGKLVSQDPNDEPAVELLKRINPKFEPCDNAHYGNLPSNWTSLILGELCFTINGLWKGKKPPFVRVGVIRNANFTKDCKLDYTNIAYLDVEEKQYEKRKLQCGDIIVEKSGGSDNQPVGRTILYEKTDGDYSFSNFTSVLRILNGYPALPEYLNMYLQGVYQTGITKRMQTQTTGIHNLIFDQYLAIPILLPPLKEQRRIINKVNELFQTLDNISAEL